MPFTVSHVAAVLPLRSAGLTGGALVTSAWVFGSMSPDLLYFTRPFSQATGIQLGHLGVAAHQLPGTLVIAPLVGAAALAWWWLIMAPAIRLGAPPRITARLAPLLEAPGLPRAWALKVYLALTMGALTHMVWDSLTHERFALGWTPQTLYTTTVAGQPAHKALQAASTVVGGLLVAWWVHRIWTRSTLPPPPPAVVGPAARPAAGFAGPPAAPRTSVPARSTPTPSRQLIPNPREAPDRTPLALAAVGAVTAGAWITQVSGSPGLRQTAISMVTTTGGVAIAVATLGALGVRLLARR